MNKRVTLLLKHPNYKNSISRPIQYDMSRYLQKLPLYLSYKKNNLLKKS